MSQRDRSTREERWRTMVRTAVAVMAFLIAACTTGHAGPAAGAAPRQSRLGPELIAALEKRDFATAKSLLARGADPHATGRNGRTALQLAVMHQDREIVRSLLARGASASQKDRDGYTLLMVAVSFSANLDIAKDLLAHGAAVDVHSDDGHTPLTVATPTGNRDIVKALLEKGAPVNAKGKDDDTPLLIAARIGSIVLVKTFMDRGADVNALNHIGETALMYAARDGNQEVGSLLLARGADARTVNKAGRTTLMSAAEGGSVELVKRLLTAGVDVNARDSAGRTALMGAGGEDADGMVRALIEKGAEVNARDTYGSTALMRAVLRGSLAAVQALLAGGADVRVKDHRGRTALTRAVTLGGADIAQALKARGAADDSAAADVRAASIRGAVEVSLPLLQTSAATFQEKVGGTCYSCHHQSLPAMAVGVARDRGFPVDQHQARKQYDFVLDLVMKGGEPAAKMLQNGKDRAAQEELERQFPGGDIHLGYGLLGIAAWDRKPHRAAGTLALVLAQRQRKEGRWGSECSVRPPAENSDFTATALAVRALGDFAPKERAKEIAPRLARARKWLAKTPPQNTEEKTFRLLGLVWAGAANDDPPVKEAIQALLADQRADGGWAQTPALKSDAYATGEVLVALHQAGGLPITDPAYQRGVTFLLRTQEGDGSWFVRSRATPFQGYIETGFPYGKDQFISATATGWATMALALAVEAPKQTREITSSSSGAIWTGR
jgi:ankyrin repeat protein